MLLRSSHALLRAWPPAGCWRWSSMTLCCWRERALGQPLDCWCA